MVRKTLIVLFFTALLATPAICADETSKFLMIDRVSKKKFSFIKLSKKVSGSYLQPVRTTPLNWSLRLNRKQTKTLKNDHLIQFAASITDSEYLILKKKKSWILYRSVASKLQKIAEADAPIAGGKISPKKLLNWFTKNLGFDGVVLEDSNGLVKIKTHKHLLKNKPQAIAYKYKENEYLLNRETNKVAGFLQFVKSEGHIGYFKKLVDKEKTLPKGTKIVIE